MRAGSILHILALGLAAYANAVYAQQRSPVAQPALLECGARGDAEIVCGTHSPEDMEPAPDDRRLIVSQMAGREDSRGGIALYDPAER